MLTAGEIIFRIVFAGLIGGLIGMEREANHRPAGLRTHVLVTLGSSLIMLISIDGFNSMGGDPARLAAQVVSGIGFLGAGTILRTDNEVKGLTTAASVWVSGGIGLAIGSGYYIGGIATSILVLFALKFLRKWGKGEGRSFNKKYDKLLFIHCNERPGLIGEIGTILGENKITIKDIKFLDKMEDENLERDLIIIQFLIRDFSDNYDDNIIMQIYSIEGVEEIMCEEEYDYAR